MMGLAEFYEVSVEAHIGMWGHWRKYLGGQDRYFFLLRRHHSASAEFGHPQQAHITVTQGFTHGVVSTQHE